jgi:hypothetical protein
MGSMKGFEKGFTNSKVASHKVLSDQVGTGGVELGNWGKNTTKTNIGLSSNSKHTTNPTEGPSYGISTRGGASGDGATPGYTGSGAGIAELNGAQGN